MHKVEIDMVSPEPVELLIEVFVHVLAGCDKPARELGREVYLFTVSPGKCLPDERFTCAIMIGIRGIDIIHAMVDRVPYHFGRRFLVNQPVSRHRKPHAPEPEDRKFGIGFFHGSVKHGLSPLSVIRIAGVVRYKLLNVDRPCPAMNRYRVKVHLCSGETMDNLLKIIEARHSARDLFDPHKPVPGRDIKKILEAGRPGLREPRCRSEFYPRGSKRRPRCRIYSSETTAITTAAKMYMCPPKVSASEPIIPVSVLTVVGAVGSATAAGSTLSMAAVCEGDGVAWVTTGVWVGVGA